MPTPNGTSADSSSADVTSLDVVKEALTPSDQGSEHENSSGSSAEGEDGKQTAAEEPVWDPLSAVKKALEKPSGDEGENQGGTDKQRTDASSSAEDGQGKKSDDEELGELTDEELQSYKPKTRRRMEKLLEDRENLTAQVADLQPQVEQYQMLTSYMRENNLGSDEVAELMVVGAMAKSGKPEDLQSAIEKTKEFLADLELAAGVKLPEDLQKKVDEGYLDADSAKEVAQSRITRERANETVTQTNHERQQEVTARQVGDVTDAISQWQQGKIKSDPDYQAKAEFLQTEIGLRVARAGGRVLDKAQALKIAEEAYTAVSDRLKKIAPRNTESKKVMRSSAVPGTNMAQQPGSALEAAKLGLQRMK